MYYMLIMTFIRVSFSLLNTLCRNITFDMNLIKKCITYSRNFKFWNQLKIYTKIKLRRKYTHELYNSHKFLREN